MPYSFAFCCLLSYTTWICKVEMLVCLQMHMKKKPWSIYKVLKLIIRFPPPQPTPAETYIHVFLVSVLKFGRNHPPLKYR